MEGKASTAALVAELDRVKSRFGAGDRAAKREALAALATRHIPDVPGLLRFHDALCFLRAYPGDPGLLSTVERALERFGARVTARRVEGGDGAVRALEETGVARTTVYCPLSHPALRWLAERFPTAAEIDWDDAETEERVGKLLPLVLALADEEALVEVGTSTRAWLQAAKRGDPRSDLAWLLARVRRGLPDPARRLVERWLELRTVWRLGDDAGSRTLAARPGPRIFFHRRDLLRWRGPLGRRLPGGRIVVRRAARDEAAALLDAARAAVVVRYREVHSFNFADPRDVLVADVGRGVRLAWFGLLPAHRLPLRAHYGYLVVKNGVPVGYGDASLLFDWVEIAYNIFETFRQGESAFIFVRLLAFLYQRFAVRAFHLSRYQIGHANDEAIASGAFWFYSKLGFRPTRPDLLQLAREERRRIARAPGARSSRRTLERLAEGGMFLAIGRRARDAAAFDAGRVGRAAAACSGRGVTTAVARWLGAPRWRRWPSTERAAFDRLAPILAAIPGLARWPPRQRRALVAVIRAKGGGEEAGYLRLMRRHRRLRAGVLRLGAERR